MAKKKAKTPPKGDRYAAKAATSQQELKALNKRWEGRQQELDHANRGASMLSEALHSSACLETGMDCPLPAWECDLLHNT